MNDYNKEKVQKRVSNEGSIRLSTEDSISLTTEKLIEEYPIAKAEFCYRVLEEISERYIGSESKPAEEPLGVPGAKSDDVLEHFFNDIKQDPDSEMTDIAEETRPGGKKISEIAKETRPDSKKKFGDKVSKTIESLESRGFLKERKGKYFLSTVGLLLCYYRFSWEGIEYLHRKAYKDERLIKSMCCILDFWTKEHKKKWESEEK
jgi:hypothetical protein